MLWVFWESFVPGISAGQRTPSAGKLRWARVVHDGEGEGLHLQRMRHHGEGGVRWGTPADQVGDVGILQQVALHRALGEPEADLGSISYLYDVGLCPDCYSSHVSEEEKCASEEILRVLEASSQAWDRAFSELSVVLPRVVREISSSMTREEIEKVIRCSFDPFLGETQATEARKKNLVNNFANRHRIAIGNHLMNRAWSQPAVAEIASRHKAEYGSLLEELRGLVKEGGEVYLPKRSSEAENLNDYIESDLTVRVPVEGSPDELFFEHVEIDPAMIQASDLKQCRYPLNMAKTVRKLITRLAGL